ncbi:MAG: TatD family nuclease-associated radical SAM protein [Methanosarcinales archaeon]
MSDLVYWLGNSLYLNITNKCPNDCYFCIKNFSKGVSEFNLVLNEEPSSAKIIAKIQEHYKKDLWKEIVFCGFGEPLMRMDCVLEVTKWIKKNLKVKVRIITTGQAYLLNKDRKVIKELKEAGVDKMSISLNAQDKETYNRICCPKYENAYQSILDFIKDAKKEFEVEVTAVKVPEVAISKVEEIARNMEVRFRER